MAGSGKTTLMQRLNAYLHMQQIPYYLINLDPAVLDTPFGANIDIRDTVNYKEVMKQYHLGPNGGILTALNLFSTRFEEVLKLIEARASSLKYVLLDTPGQIEIFTWSASGAVITESLASMLPTVILYIIDTPRSSNAVTFMSNMLYACSIMYKTKLPLLLVFNKTDIKSHDFAVQWMQDLGSFEEALQEERSYMGTLATSMALMLEEFYSKLTLVGVSALTGEGMQELFAAIDVCGAEFETTCANRAGGEGGDAVQKAGLRPTVPLAAWLAHLLKLCVPACTGMRSSSSSAGRNCNRPSSSGSENQQGASRQTGRQNTLAPQRALEMSWSSMGMGIC